MADFLLELAANPVASKAVRALKLPLPLPQALKRARGPWTERPLEGNTVAVVPAPTSELSPVLGSTLAQAGASVLVVGTDASARDYRAAGEAYARDVRVLPPVQPPEGERIDAIVYDASALESPEALRQLYDFFHPWLRSVQRSGKVVVVQGPTGSGAARAAAGAAVEGFVRALAKELGRKGVTVNLLRVGEGAHERVRSPLRFLLSRHSAFVTGQPLSVTNRVRAEGAAPLARLLDRKVALVTGAARGIGAVTARRLAEEGAHVVCIDRPGEEERLGVLARDIGGSLLGLDVTDGEAPRTLVEHLREQHGGVDVVVHNAGVTADRTLGRMKGDAWDRVIRVNLAAVCRITEHMLDEAVVCAGGRIVVMSSVSGIAGNAGQTNYSASKAGLIGMVRDVSPRVADRGITVNAIAPGLIETEMTAKMPAGIREVARRLSALGQGGLPQDVAEAVTFLASPGAVGISGSVLRVCGGAFVGA